MRGIKGLLIFVAGAVSGAVAGAYLVKDKIMSDAREEINEVREYYKSKKHNDKNELTQEVEEANTVEEPQEVKTKEEDMKEMERITSSNGYVNYNKITEVEKEVTIEIKTSEQIYNDKLDNPPYIIEPDEYGEDPAYDSTSYTYFADGVLVDDVDDVVEEPDIVVGLDNLKIFDEFGANSIYVRNDLYKMDIEVLRDDWNWKDIDGNQPEVKKPHQI